MSPGGCHYEVIKSRYNPSNQIRLKNHEPGSICHGGVPSHSGWADIAEHHMFFWYFEARHPADDTPVLVWFTGGPGGSSVTSAFVENGDCSFDEALNGTKLNPHGWTESFHMVFLDQPAGVGLSYVNEPNNTSAYPDTVNEAALDVVAFLRLFAEAFPHLAQHPVHLAGESYGGRWVPAFGDMVLQYNDLVGKGAQIPLASLVSMSAWTDPPTQLSTLYDVACHPFKEYSATMNASACEALAMVVPKCDMMMEACRRTGDGLMCTRGGEFCDREITSVVTSHHVNKYDRRMWCEIPGQCYPIMLQMEAWMNTDPIFRGVLEVPEQSAGLKLRYEFLSMLVHDRFQGSGDYYMSTLQQVQRTLTRPKSTRVPMLFTASDCDILVNPKGLEKSLERIQWPGQPLFRSAPWVHLPWTTESGTPAGRVKSSGPLWYAELEEAGHMAARDSPKAVLQLMRTWVARIEKPEEK
ncbi:alpha/beta-hydrolase [Thozetella sp. PMI_491]|nr:alpha/beta-hydrolase [Thozetella sp. PMI_491]